MTNINKELAEDTKERVEKQFTEFLGSLSSDDAENFYSSFFTESEQIMFIKRLAVLMMLEKSAKHRHIAAVLNISPMTVSRINQKKQSGEYDDFTELFATEKRESRLWKALAIAIEEGVHQYSGSSWGWLDRVEEIQQ